MRSIIIQTCFHHIVTLKLKNIGTKCVNSRLPVINQQVAVITRTIVAAVCVRTVGVTLMCFLITLVDI